jgi:hypothetical protein
MTSLSRVSQRERERKMARLGAIHNKGCFYCFVPLIRLHLFSVVCEAAATLYMHCHVNELIKKEDSI